MAPHLSDSCCVLTTNNKNSVLSNMVCWYKATCLYMIAYLILHILQCMVSNICGLSCVISNWSFVWILSDTVYQCTTSPLSEISSEPSTHWHNENLVNIISKSMASPLCVFSCGFSNCHFVQNFSHMCCTFMASHTCVFSCASASYRWI